MLIYLTGGKTLGHITPLINIYNYFKSEHEFIYVGLIDSLEEEMCKKNNIEFIGVTLKGLSRSNMFVNIEVFKLINKAKKYLLNNIKQTPDLVIASSGFVSIPLLSIAKKHKIKYILLEQNTTLGLVNKLYYRKSKHLLLSLPINKKLKKGIVSGNFVLEQKSDYDNILFYTKKPKILMFFGSMGSDKLYDFFVKNDNLFTDYKVFIVVPNKYYDKYVFKNYIKLKPIYNINNIFDKFELLITRAGATTIAEILNSNTKALLIPSPNVVNNHQLKNAILMKQNYLMDYIEESNLNFIEDSLIDIYKYNDINKRTEFNKVNPYQILAELIMDCDN